MKQFGLRLSNLSVGSLEAKISFQGQSIKLYPSSIFSPIAALASATSDLMGPSDIVRFEWQDEPGTYRWVLRKTGAEVETRIFEFKNTFSRLPDEKGIPIFEASTTLLRFSTQAKGAIHQLLNQFGEEELAIRFRHPCPLSDFGIIEQRLHILKDQTKTNING